MPTLAQKWDNKYQQETPPTISACWVLQQHINLLPLTGKGLDLASGLGGNARLMAQCGLSVEAWDISDVALTQLNNWAASQQLKIKPILTDIDNMLFPYQQFDVIVVSQFLNRNLFPQIELALKPNGLLYYQTFLAPQQPNAPRNPDFYIKTGEFSQAWPKLKTLVYGEGFLNKGMRHAWYVGQKEILKE